MKQKVGRGDRNGESLASFFFYSYKKGRKETLGKTWSELKWFLHPPTYMYGRRGLLLHPMW